MFNPVFTDPNDALLKDRLARISQQLRAIQLSTAEDYQAEVYSRVNAILSLGEAMTPLQPVGAEGPAVVGDATANFITLNNDAQDIAKEMLRVEDTAASLFNLAATSQNQLRQQIREFTFAPTTKKYTEAFLNSNNIQSNTASIDFNAGLATNTLLDQTQLTPIISIGQNSTGALDSGSSMSNLTDGNVQTAMVWDGAQLELLFTFPTAQIVNRLTISMDNYAGLQVPTLLTSPDGILIQDILADLGVSQLTLDASASKFSGDVIIDFPPRHAKVLRLILLDKTGLGFIALREAALWARRYQSTGQLTSVAISTPTGTVNFTTQQNTFFPYVNITHQISYDNVAFTAITPGTPIALTSSPFYYRAVLERSASIFRNAQGVLNQTPLDPVPSANYTVASTTTVPLGNGIIERTIALNNVTGSIVLRETPMPNTLQIQQGAVILSQSTGAYTFANNTIIFPGSVSGIIISYQTSSLGQAAVSDLEDYYTALLYQIQFGV